jgi:TolB-like protein
MSLAALTDSTTAQANGNAYFIKVRSADGKDFKQHTIPADAIDSIAVLPLVNTSNDPNAEYLSDGISEALINSLTELRQLRVIARSTAFHYKGKDIDPRQVGRELNVRAVLMGRVRQMGDTLNIQVDLVDATTGAQLWGQEYERKVSDVLSIKQAIAREVTEKLRLRLSGGEERQLTKRDTTNAEAYRFYLRGRFFWNKRTTADLRKAIGYHFSIRKKSGKHWNGWQRMQS